MKFGVYNTTKNKVIYSYESNRMKSLNLATDEIQFEMLESNGDNWNDEKAYKYEAPNVVYDTEYDPFDPTQKHCKIYRYIPQASKRYRLTSPPVEHNYKIGLTTNLYPTRHYNKGELYKVEYFADKEKTDIVIEVNIVYNRDTLGFALDRTTTREWYLEDGTKHPTTKITEKVYNEDMLIQMKEVARLRGNIVEGIKMPVLGSMIATILAKDGESEPERQARVIIMGRDFLATHKVAFTNFIEDSNREIIEDLTKANDYWLDNVIDSNGTTIRDYMLNELDIGGIG